MQVKVNQAQVAEIKILLSGVKNGAPRVMSKGINKTITSTVTFAAKEIGKHYNLTQKRIKEDFIPKKSTVSNLGGAIFATGEPVSLTSFIKTTQVKDGVSVMIKKDTGRFRWRHAFIRVVKNARQAWYRPLPPGVTRSRQLYKVWKRSDKYGVLPEKYRYGPYKGKTNIILRLTGPRVEDEYGKPRTLNPVQKHANDRLQVEINQALNFELSKL